MNRKITSLLAFIELAQQAERKSRRRMRRRSGGVDVEPIPAIQIDNDEKIRKRMMKRRRGGGS